MVSILVKNYHADRTKEDAKVGEGMTRIVNVESGPNYAGRVPEWLRDKIWQGQLAQ
jgi:hypothetical protein